MTTWPERKVIRNMNGKFIIVDMKKNTVLIDADLLNKMFSALPERELERILKDHTVRHETLSEMDRDIHGWIKGYRERK